MTSVTTDKHINFVLENYADISAIEEMLVHARNNLSGIIEKLVQRCIRELEEEFATNNVVIDDAMDWYSETQYNPEKGVGLYFGCEGNFGYMLDGGDPDDAPYLYLLVDTTGVKKRERKENIDREFAKISRPKFKAKLRKEGIVVESKDYDEPYLLSYPLYREINFNTIMDKEKLVKAVKKAILNFTNIVMRNYPSK